MRQLTYKQKVGIIVGLVFIFALISVYVIASKWISNTHNHNYEQFKKMYHNDYITTIKLFIQDCKHIYDNRSVVIVRHLIDVQGKHLGIIYRCEGLPNNITKTYTSDMTLSVKYTPDFYIS